MSCSEGMDLRKKGVGILVGKDKNFNILLLSWICYRLFTMSDVARPARGSAIR